MLQSGNKKVCILLKVKEKEFCGKLELKYSHVTPSNLFQVFGHLVNTSALVSTRQDLSDVTVSKDSKEKDVNKT